MRDIEYDEFPDVVCARETAKAIQVTSDNGGPYWLPKSTLAEHSEVQGEGDKGTLAVATWFVRKEGVEL